MVYDQPDITGTGAAIALSATRVPAQFIVVSTPAANTGSIRIGGISVSASRGVAVPAGTTGLVVFPPIGDGMYLDLSKVFMFAAAGDKLTWTYGRK